MAKKRRRRARKRPLRRKILIWGMTIFALVTLTRALVGEKGLLAVWRHRREVASIELEIERLRERNKDLKEQVSRLRKDPRAVEPVAREELGFARADEILILLPREQPR